MEEKHQDDLTKVLIFSGDSHVKEYDASKLKNEIKFTNTLRNITHLLNAQKPELPTYNLQKPKNYTHFHVDLKNVKSVLLKNKTNDKYAVILYRDNTIKNNYRFNFLQLQNKTATVHRLSTNSRKIKNEEQTNIKLYTNKKYLNNASNKRKVPHNIRNNTNSQYKLKKLLQKQLLKEKERHFCANAIFNIKKISQKVILSREINNDNDIRNFVENVKHFNNSSILQWQQKMAQKLKSLNIELAKILIIIQINNFTAKMYLNMGRNTAKFKHVHKINNKYFVNIKSLDIKLQNIKKIDIKANKDKFNKFNISSGASETNLIVKHSMEELDDQLKGATFKEMCKMLLKLQYNSRVECKKLYTNYSAFKKIAFNEEIFEIVQKVVCKFSAITRAQQNANIELINLKHSLSNAVRSFEKVQSAMMKSLILRKLEEAIKEDEILDPRILFPSDYKSLSSLVSKENMCVQTEEKIVSQNDFEVQFNIDIDRVESVESLQKNVFTICTQTSQNSLDIINQISSNISTQTAISIHKCTSIQFPGEHVQLRKNVIIHKIKNSLDQVKNIYDANSQIMKQIANCATNISFTNLDIKQSDTETTKKEETPLFEEIMKKNEAIVNKVETMKMVANTLKAKADATQEVKDPEDQMTAEDMKRKVDTVRMKVEDLKRQVDTPHFVFDVGVCKATEEIIKQEDEALHVEEVIINEAKNKEELIKQIKNTLNSVTERFKQNRLIIAEAANLKKDYKLAKNFNKIIRPPLKGEESSASFKKAVRQLDGPPKPVLNKHTLSKAKELPKSLTTSMKVLKHLNEVTKFMKNQPKDATKKLMEMKQALITQLKNLATIKKQSMNKIKYNKANITLAPIKNHIHNNKQMVSLNAIRALANNNNNSQQSNLDVEFSGGKSNLTILPAKYLPKHRPVGNTALTPSLNKIMPNVHSKHILQFRDSRDKKRQLYATFGYRNSNNKVDTPVVHTRKDNPLIAKIVRPIRNTQVEEFLPKLSQLSLRCVKRFRPEYPRKDHLHELAPKVEESYLFKLLNTEIGCNSVLEPLVKCSSKECNQCTVNSSTSGDTKKPISAPSDTREIIHSLRNNKNFDFKQFMRDPALTHTVNYTVCPVDLTLSNKNPLKDRAPSKTAAAKKSSVTAQSKASKMSTPSQKKNSDREEHQNKIQKSVQQAILKNQEKFMMLHAFISDRNAAVKNVARAPKPNNVANITPKVYTPAATYRKPNAHPVPKQEEVKLKNNHKRSSNPRSNIHKSRTSHPNKNVSSVAFFDKKYGNKTSLSSIESNEIVDNEKTTFTQGQLQNYITQVETKFINTFSMKEEEKAHAYDNLTTEIEDMLYVLKTSGAKLSEATSLSEETPKNIKESDNSESTTETLSQKEQIVNNFLTAPMSPPIIITHCHPMESSQSTFSEPSKQSIDWGKDDSGAKKKASYNSGPTIISDHISFNESLTAIRLKETSLFHVHSTSNCRSAVPVSIIRKCKSDTKMPHPRKMRISLSSLKIDKSDESFLTSIAEEEQLSMCNDITSVGSSANTLSFPEIATEYLVEVHFKITVHFSYSCQIAQVTYFTTLWQDIDFELPIVKNTKPLTAAYIKKYDIDIDKISDNNMSLKSDYSWESVESETLECNTSKDILNLPDSKFEIDSEFIEKYYSSLKLKELFTDVDESDNTGEAIIPSNSPKILQFLDMLTSLTKDEDLVVKIATKQEVYHKYNFSELLTSCHCYVYHLTNVFEQVSFTMTDQKMFNQCYNSALYIQSNQLQKLIDQNQNQRTFKDVTMPRFISMPDHNLYSIATINSDRKFASKHNLFNTNKCYSDTKFDFDDKSSKKRKTDSLCQNTYLNLQVNKKKRKINRLMKIAKRVVVDHFTPLLKQNSRINENFTFKLSAVNTTDISDTLKLVLIFLYVTVFAFIFLCMTLNYSCE